MKLGIFLPNWVGDAVMATPTLRALRRQFGPHARFVAVARPSIQETLAGTPWIDEWLLYDPRDGEGTLGVWPLVRQLRSYSLDATVLLTNSFRTAALAWFGGAKQRVGYARNLRSPLLTARLAHRREHGRWAPTPVLDDYLRLAYALGCPKEKPRLELATLAADECRADDLWRQLGLDNRRDVIAINSSGAFGSAKLWPTEYFAELARRLATRHDVAALVLCGPAEREIAREIARQADHPQVVSLADQSLSIGLTKACVRRSRLMVTTDSGPRHFASAFGVPVVTLFGPTHIAWSETHDPRAVHVQHAVPCGPCQQRVCPEGHHRCMRDLTVDTVWAAVESLWEKSVRRAA